MPPARPTCASVRFSPESGSTRIPAMLPTMVTSSPSRIQVIPNAAITNQCHRAHGNLSIRDGMRLSTALPTALASLTPYSSLSAGPHPRPLGRLFCPLLTLCNASLTPPDPCFVVGGFANRPYKQTVLRSPVCLFLRGGTNRAYARGARRTQLERRM